MQCGLMFYACLPKGGGGLQQACLYILGWPMIDHMPCLLQVISMEGFGCDAYLHLNRLGNVQEPLP